MEGGRDAREICYVLAPSHHLLQNYNSSANKECNYLQVVQQKKLQRKNVYIKSCYRP